MGVSNTLIGAAALFGALMRPLSTHACALTGEGPTLRRLMSELPLAATVEVVAQGRIAKDGLEPDEQVAYLDVRVVKRFRGPARNQVVRVWDEFFGSSCGYGLSRLSVGTYAALAAHRSSHAPQEQLDVLGIKPRPEDYVLGGAGLYIEILDSRAAAEKFSRRGR
jgi:hypothetical protein